MSGREKQAAASLRQVVEQGLRILQIARVEAFGEPGVDRREEGAGLIARPFPLDLIAAGNTQPPGVRDGVCAVELHPSVATR